MAWIRGMSGACRCGRAALGLGIATIAAVARAELRIKARRRSDEISGGTSVECMLAVCDDASAVQQDS